MTRQLRILITGGGTGGHVFPAIAIADALKRQLPGADFLFVGANGKMEMERVPKAGYPIEGLNIAVSVHLVPSTGLTLPMISMGGTSMVFTSIALGMILSVSKFIENIDTNPS